MFPLQFMYFGFLYLTNITSDGFEQWKMKQSTLFYRERQPLVFIFWTTWIFITRLIKVQVNHLPSQGKPSPRYSTFQDFILSSWCDLHDQDTKAKFTQYRTNFRPVENSWVGAFRSHGTTPNVRKFGRPGVQNFEHENRGRIFSRCSQ